MIGDVSRGSTYTYTVNNGRKTVRFRSSRWSSFADGHPQFESVSSVLISRVYSSLAQLVECLTVNQVVAGSSPAGGAKNTEAWLSGLKHPPTKRTRVNSPPRVRIPTLPPIAKVLDVVKLQALYVVRKLGDLSVGSKLTLNN
jgi:hypothetical protein